MTPFFCFFNPVCSGGRRRQRGRPSARLFLPAPARTIMSAPPRLCRASGRLMSGESSACAWEMRHRSRVDRGKLFRFSLIVRLRCALSRSQALKAPPYSRKHNARRQSRRRILKPVGLPVTRRMRRTRSKTFPLLETYTRSCHASTWTASRAGPFQYVDIQQYRRKLRLAWRGRPFPSQTPVSINAHKLWRYPRVTAPCSR